MQTRGAAPRRHKPSGGRLGQRRVHDPKVQWQCCVRESLTHQQVEHVEDGGKNDDKRPRQGTVAREAVDQRERPNRPECRQARDKALPAARACAQLVTICEALRR